jgi:hypothetical protein
VQTDDHFMRDHVDTEAILVGGGHVAGQPRIERMRIVEISAFIAEEVEIACRQHHGQQQHAGSAAGALCALYRGPLRHACSSLVCWLTALRIAGGTAQFL